MMGILLFALINMINHINLVCIILKANSFRLSALYNLFLRALVFSDDIYKNWIILETFANRETMRDALYFIIDKNIF